MPRMLIDCGHTICGQCLKELKNTQKEYTCPDDNKVSLFSIPEIGDPLFYFIFKGKFVIG
jgi:hypothetical protein